MKDERPVRSKANSFRHGGTGEPASEGRSLNIRAIGWTLGAEVACQSGLEGSRCGWRQNGRKVAHVTRGDLEGRRGVGPPPKGKRVMIASPPEVRAPVVASKPGNAGGAKGRRKVDA